MGKGYAVRSGFKFATGKYVLMLDADNATSKHEILEFHRKIQELEAKT